VLAAVVVCLLGAAPPVAKLAAPGFAYSRVEPAVGDAIIDRLATQLVDRGVRVVTRRDLEQAVGLDRQRELAGCGDSSSCLTELIGGLGFDALLIGSIAKLGTAYTVTVRVIQAADARERYSASARVKSEDALQDWFDDQAPRIADALQGPQSASAVRVTPWIPGGVGVLCVVAASILFGLGKADAAQLGAMPPPSLDQVDLLAARGQSFERAGVGLFIGAAVAIAVSAVWIVLLGREP
jgi:hypothetical protein